MEQLTKIKDISARYTISARALRYYEDMGLITSTRNSAYAYRLYDPANVTRLEQILILRKLNVSIRDIQRIFDSPGSGIVLEVLRQKVDSIDEEVSLMHELKEIVLGFIRQIEQADFNKSNDVQLLYDKAKELETRLANVDYSGNASAVNRLLDVSEKLKKAPEVRIVRINPFRALTSGLAPIDTVMEVFGPWQEAHNHLVKKLPYGAPDFLWFESDGAEWIWAVEDGVTEADTAPYPLITFEGGLYAEAMSVDGDDDIGGRVYHGILKWLEGSRFELDDRPGHRVLCHMLNPSPTLADALGYQQLDIYVPIKIKEEHKNGKN